MLVDKLVVLVLQEVPVHDTDMKEVCSLVLVLHWLICIEPVIGISNEHHNNFQCLIIGSEKG